WIDVLLAVTSRHTTCKEFMNIFATTQSMACTITRLSRWFLRRWCNHVRAVGHAYIYMLGWRESPTKLDEYWRRIKTSLHGIVVARLPVYMTTYQETRAAITSLCQRNLRKLEPPERCHVNDMDNYCELCLCYK
ncbi:unnamed protein product, partial [Brassica rapa subsp. trilocularis]